MSEERNLDGSKAIWDSLDCWGHRILWIVGLMAALSTGIVGYATVAERSCRNEERIEVVDREAKERDMAVSAKLEDLDRKMTRVLTILERSE